MSLRGRARELGALRQAFDRPEPSLVQVVGLPGSGKTALVREASRDFRAVYHRAPPLSDPQQRDALAATLREAGVHGLGDAAPPDWDALFGALVSWSAPGRATVLVVDDAHRWAESRARFSAALSGALTAARAAGRAVHFTLVAPEPPSPAAELSPLVVPPLSLRAAAPFLPGSSPRDILRAYAVFGGLPSHLTLLDPSASLGTNLRRLVLADGAPLRDAPLVLLERLFQTPTRYAAILAALSPGEGDWGVVHAGVPDLTASGQAGPYLNRLAEVGLLEVRRSLDASPRTRSRRYRITDPFFAFWFRFVLPSRHRFAQGDGESLYADVVRPALDEEAAAAFPQACRDFMSHDAMERLGTSARECGSLWGAGYDIPVAGVLGSGAPFYGLVVVDTPGADPSALTLLDGQVRETRYGFGRERRLRVLFHGGDVPSRLQREVARREDAVLVGLSEVIAPGTG